MVRKKSSSSNIDEYELMPVKPLQELQREMRQLRKEITREDSSQKLLVKLLNSNLATQQKIIEQNYKLEELKTHLKKFVDVIQNIELDDEHEHDLNKLHLKMNDLHDKHDDLTRAFKQFGSKDVFTAFRRLPSGIPIKYKRRNDK